MTARDQDQGAYTAFEWAIKKYWATKTDAQLARGLNTTEDIVREMREELGLIRPRSTESMKDFARRYLMEMDDDEKREFIKGLPEDLVWKMAEGNPASTGELTVNHEPLKIDIRQQVIKVYGPIPTTELAAGNGPGDGSSTDRMLTDGEGSRSTAATG